MTKKRKKRYTSQFITRIALHPRNELHSLLSTHDVVFKSLNDEDKIRYLLTLENETTYLIHIFNVSEEKRHPKFKIIKYNNFIPIALEVIV